MQPAESVLTRKYLRLAASVTMDSFQSVLSAREVA
jgi:hypothetical protein